MSLQRQIRSTTPIYNIFAGYSLGKLQEIANIVIVLGKILEKEGLNKEVGNITE